MNWIRCCFHCLVLKSKKKREKRTYWSSTRVCIACWTATCDNRWIFFNSIHMKKGIHFSIFINFIFLLISTRVAKWIKMILLFFFSSFVCPDITHYCFMLFCCVNISFLPKKKREKKSCKLGWSELQDIRMFFT